MKSTIDNNLDEVRKNSENKLTLILNKDKLIISSMGLIGLIIIILLKVTF